MAAHLYYRIYLNHSTWVALSEVQMRETHNGPDQCVGGVASSSGHYFTQVPANAFDDNAGTYFETASTSGIRWIQYQFATPKDIVEIAIAPTSAYPGEYPSSISVSYSDNGTDWTEVMPPRATSGYRDGISLEVFYFPATKSYWRLNITEGQAVPTYLEIGEIEFRSAVGGADITLPNGVNAVKAFNTWIAGSEYGAFDNSSGAWSCLSGTSWWIWYHFPEDVDIVEYTVRSHPAQYSQYAPKAWNLERSADGINWTVIDSRSGQTGWAIDEQRTYTLTPPPAPAPAPAPAPSVVTFPGLPSGAELDSAKFQIVYEDEAIRSQQQDLVTVARPRNRRIPRRTFKCGYTMLSGLDKGALEEFWEDVSGNALIFQWASPQDGVTYSVRFKGPMKFTLVRKTPVESWWDCEFDLRQA